MLGEKYCEKIVNARNCVWLIYLCFPYFLYITSYYNLFVYKLVCIFTTHGSLRVGNTIYFSLKPEY